MWQMPLLWLLGALLVVNGFGYGLARHDKGLAVRNRNRPVHRRVPERTFYVVALLGGGLGVFAAFVLHRHKTRKPRFLVPFVAATLVGAAAVAALAAWVR